MSLIGGTFAVAGRAGRASIVVGFIAHITRFSNPESVNDAGDAWRLLLHVAVYNQSRRQPIRRKSEWGVVLKVSKEASTNRISKGSPVGPSARQPNPK